jgi:hypothetical protein
VAGRDRIDGRAAFAVFYRRHVPTVLAYLMRDQLEFIDSAHGVALGYVGSIAQANERLYCTTDGGQSYHPVRLP